MIQKRSLFSIWTIIVFLAVLPLFTFFFSSSYLLTPLTMSIYYSCVIMALTVFMGYTGQISLAQGAFFAIGAYSGVLFHNYHYSFILNLLLSLSISAAVAYLIGKPILKLKGHYLAMATLGFGIIIYKIIIGNSFLGLAEGLTMSLPSSLFDFIPNITHIGDRIFNYYLALILALFIFILLSKLISFPTGNIFKAIHDDEVALNSCGIDSANIKLKIFILAAVVSALAGFFFAHFNGGISPDEAHFSKSMRYVAIVAVSSFSNLRRAFIFGMILNFLSLRGYFGTFDDTIFAVILILAMFLQNNPNTTKKYLLSLLHKLQSINPTKRNNIK